MRSFLALAACVLFAVSPAAARAEDPAPTARLQAVAQEQNLLDPSLKPWHLKLAVQLFDATGAATETGAIEEWWAAPDKYREVFTSPSYNATIVRNASGTMQTPGTGSAPYLMSELLRLVTHPVDLAKELPNSTPTLRHQKLGTIDAECILLDRKIKGFGSVPLGLYPTYCIQQGSNLLLARSEISELSALSAAGAFQGKHIPVDLTILINGVKAASEHVAALQSTLPDAAEFSNVDGLVAIDDKPVTVGAEVMAAMIVKPARPVYPPRDRQHGIEGTVVLHAIIGTEGSIHELSLVSAQDVDMAISAGVAVRQCIYSPYLLNGKPVPVETNIAVKFPPGR